MEPDRLTEQSLSQSESKGTMRAMAAVAPKLGSGPEQGPQEASEGSEEATGKTCVLHNGATLLREAASCL